MKSYYLYLSLLLFSIFGTALTDFSLGIWVLDTADSGSGITSYTMIWFFQAAPAAFLAPFMGSFIDRWDKQRIIIIGQLVSGAASVLLILLYHYGMLQEAMILPLVGISNIANAFVFRAFYVAIPVLVGRKKLSRAHGILSSSFAAIQMGVPVMAPICYKLIGLSAIFSIDVDLIF